MTDWEIDIDESAGTTENRYEGWGGIGVDGQRKEHYFVPGKLIAICGKAQTFGLLADPGEPVRGPDDCLLCGYLVENKLYEIKQSALEELSQSTSDEVRFRW